MVRNNSNTGHIKTFQNLTSKTDSVTAVHETPALSPIPPPPQVMNPTTDSVLRSPPPRVSLITRQGSAANSPLHQEHVPSGEKKEGGETTHDNRQAWGGIKLYVSNTRLVGILFFQNRSTGRKKDTHGRISVNIRGGSLEHAYHGKGFMVVCR